MVKAFRPATLKEALEHRANNQMIPIAGGTDLMVKRRNWSGLTPTFERDVLFIPHLKELKGIRIVDSKLYIGAGSTLNELKNHPTIPYLMKEIILRMSSPAIRNIATVGGNICNASPAGDLLPILYGLNALLVLISAKGERKVNIENFIMGPAQHILEDNELLKEIVLDDNDFNITYYKKVGNRKANSLSKVSFVGLANIRNEKIMDLRIAFGAVAPSVVRKKEIEREIIGLSVEEVKKHILEILHLYAIHILPIDDQRSSSTYRKKVSLSILEHFFVHELKKNS